MAQQQWRQRAGRRGAADGPSDFDDQDYEQGSSSDEYYDSDDEDFEGRAGSGDVEMRLYLDCANVKEWEKWAEAGLFYGFTTNPTILKRDGVRCNIRSMRQLAREAFDLGMEELQLQAWGANSEELCSCGLDILDIDSRIVVKLPITLEGAKAAHKLIADGAPVTMTGVYARHQVVTSLAMGAAYAAPYLGRMTDAGENGVEEVVSMQGIVDQSSEEGGMRLLVASIRSPDEIAELAARGCNTFTISPAVALNLFDVKLTQDAARVFHEHAIEMGALDG